MWLGELQLISEFSHCYSWSFYFLLRNSAAKNVPRAGLGYCS